MWCDSSLHSLSFAPELFLRLHHLSFTSHHIFLSIHLPFHSLMLTALLPQCLIPTLLTLKTARLLDTPGRREHHACWCCQVFLKMNCCSRHRGEVGHSSRALKTSVYQCLMQAIEGARDKCPIFGPNCWPEERHTNVADCKLR